MQELEQILKVGVTSRQIAEETGKQHKHVRRDIRRMLEQLAADGSRFEATYLDAYGREQKQYVLDEDHAMILVMGYDPLLCQKIYRLCKALAKPKTLEERIQEQALQRDNQVSPLKTQVEQEATWKVGEGGTETGVVSSGGTVGAQKYLGIPGPKENPRTE